MSVVETFAKRNLGEFLIRNEKTLIKSTKIEKNIAEVKRPAWAIDVDTICKVIDKIDFNEQGE